MKKLKALAATLAGFVLSTGVASAHEVYVLNQAEIDIALAAPQPDFLAAITAHLGQFLSWGLISIAVVCFVFFISIAKPVEKLLDPWLHHLKKWAPRMAQFTLGSALAAGGYFHAIFGVELPLSSAFGPYAGFASWLLMVVGAMLIIGILPRVAGMITTALFVALTVEHGVYMLNYCTYLGEGLTLALFGGAYSAYSSSRLGSVLERGISPAFHAYKFFIMRSLFGVSLIYASLYAKFIHGDLALMVVSKYDLTRYFHFDPVFLVLGAMTIEVLIGLFIIIGFEVRFTSLFFIVFLTMSLLFFGESVWPHIILIGTAISTFMHGYDEFSLSWRLEGRKRMEPVL